MILSLVKKIISKPFANHCIIGVGLLLKIDSYRPNTGYPAVVII